MAKKISAALGIDIGSQKIKVAEVKLSGKEPVITGLAIVDTPEGMVDHTGVYDVDTIAESIKGAMHSIGSSASHLIFSIAGQQSVLVRTTEVGRMTPAELKDHMQWEITKNIPFAESTVQSDYKAFPADDPAATMMDVVMAIAPQSAVDTLIGIAKKVGKPIGAIDVEPLAVARTLVQGHMNDYANQVVCVVEVGHKTMSINMYRNGKLLMPRLVPIGGEMFTKAISENLALPLEEAEAIKLSKGSIPQSAMTGGYVAQTQSFQAFSPFNDPAAFNPNLAIPGMDAGGPPGSVAQPYNPFEAEAPPASSDVSNFVPFNAGGAPADEPNPYAMPPADEAPMDPNAGFMPAEEPPAFVPMPEPAPAAPPAASMPSEDAETMRVYNAIAQIVEEFVAEVRRSVDYFQSKGSDVNRILLCGGGGTLQGLPQLLEKSLGVPCELFDPLAGISMNARKSDPTLADTHRQHLTIAIGNALSIAFD